MKINFTSGLFSVLFLFLGLFNAWSQPGIDGIGNITSSGSVVNAYTPLLSSATACSITISANIAALSNGTPLSAGSLVMIISMQGATIDTTNTTSYGQILNYNGTGTYEFASVSGVSGVSTITLQSPLKNSYIVGGTRRVQVVRVPQYTTLTVNAGASIVGVPWNGSKGGIVAVTATGNVTVNGSVNADTIGFRGGVAQGTATTNGVTTFKASTAAQGGEKGESIVGFETDYDALGGRYCRGAAANGGGGGDGENASAGGGANGDNNVAWNGQGNPDISGGANWITAWNLESANFANNVSSGGGRGGYSWGFNQANPIATAPGNTAWGGDNHRIVGGLGGRPLASNSENTIFFGGGGGAGHMDSNNGTDGGNGGGIVYIVASNVTGTGVISANGQSADTSGLHVLSFNDGSGGGGGGGTIIIKSPVASTLALQVKGGRGGCSVSSNFLALNESEGGGGGGGGGYIAITSGTPTVSISGGANGTISSNGNVGFPPSGGTMGATGQLATVSNTFTTHDSISLVSNPASICPGGSAVITASGGASYAWSTGGLTSSITISPGNTGSYTVTATFASGCTATASQLVTVNTAPTAGITGTATSCGPVSLTATGGSTYNWSGGSSPGSATNTFTSSGTYIVTVTDANNCSSSVSQVVAISGALTVGITGSPTGCGSVVLTATGGTSYAWSGGNTPNSGTNTFTSDGTYIVTVTNGGCSGTASQLVTVHQAAASQFAQVICTGQSYNFNNQNLTQTGTYMDTVQTAQGCDSSITLHLQVLSNSLNFVLSTPFLCPGDSSIITFGTGDSALSISPVSHVTWLDSLHAVMKPDTTTFYTISGYSPCRSHVIDNLTLPVGNGTVNITADKTNMCSGDTARICAPTGFTSYHWNTGDSTACINAQLAGNYYVTVSENSNCTAQSNHLAIHVFIPSAVSLSVNGDTLTGYNASAYQWLLNGVPISGATSSVYIANTSGSYTLQVTDTNGCTSTSTPISITGVAEEFIANSVRIFPNPTKQLIDIYTSGNQILYADLTDLSGKRVIENLLLSNHLTTLDLSAFSAGVYLLRVRDKIGGIKVVKVFKE